MTSKRPVPDEVAKEVGKLCVSWSFLEILSESTIWGILDLDFKIGPIITWRLDLRSRWQIILDHAHKKHSLPEIAYLKAINKDLVPVTRDRNIIVHGAMHFLESKQHPCWTVFRGAEAGKNFPVSAEAVSIVSENIKLLQGRVSTFNEDHDYPTVSSPLQDPEAGWPTPLS